MVDCLLVSNTGTGIAPQASEHKTTDTLNNNIMHLPAVTAKIKAATLSITGISVGSTMKIKETAVSFLQNILSPRRKKRASAAAKKPPALRHLPNIQKPKKAQIARLCALRLF